MILTAEERSQIISEDYADLLIAYGGDLSILEPFQNYTIRIISNYLAIVQVPAIMITNTTIEELGYSVMPSLYGIISEASLEASGVTRLRSVPGFNLRGSGVLIGIIDSGIQYTNPVFQYADKTTRITSIWDQTIVSENYPDKIFYGTAYTREDINRALKSENPLEIVPSTDVIGHGTMLAGVSAGNEVPDSNFAGVAPDSELIIVKLKQAKTYLRNFFGIPDNVTCYQENDIIQGIQYVLTEAANINKPVIICVALGTSQGAHDGKGTLSNWLSIQADKIGVGAVVAAGNEGNNRRHYSGTVGPILGYDTVELNVGPNEKAFSMELWGNTPSIFSIDILSPSGEYIPRIETRLDESRVISFIFEDTIIYIDYQMYESQSGDQLILMRFFSPAQGIWRFRVYGRGDLPKSFNMWLPMGDFITSETFFIRSDPYTTILSLGNARVPITVTAYNDEDDSLYINSSRGYTRIEVIKPEIAAPGVNILSPSVEGGFVEVTGTSAAAAHATGVTAMLFEWGVVKGNYINMDTLDAKIFMMRGARRDPNLQYPNRDWGYGILDVYNIFDALRRGSVL